MLIWTTEKPGNPGFYWFKGLLEGNYGGRGVILSTVVDIASRDDQHFEVYFPQGESPVPLSGCNGQWAGPLTPPE